MTAQPASPAVARDVLPAAVLFDMDGLLIDTEPVWFEVETQILAELGASWTPADHAKLVGTSALVAATFISERAGGRATPEQVRAEVFSRMTRRMREPREPQRGAAELIAEIDDAGIPRALVSSSARALIDAALESVAPLSFEVVVAGEDVTHSKPHPEPYLLAAQRLGVDPPACVALEDSPTGAESATRAGCVVIAVPSVAAIEPAARRVVVPRLVDVDLAFMRSLFRQT